MGSDETRGAKRGDPAPQRQSRSRGAPSLFDSLDGGFPFHHPNQESDHVLGPDRPDFFDACETGQGWAGCAAYCHAAASFACQSDALAEVTTIMAYTEWMKGLLTPIPDGRYELTAFAVDDARSTAVAAAVFHGTQTGEGGPVPPTGKAVASEYVFTIVFDGPKVRHVTKTWNDAQALRQLGWA